MNWRRNELLRTFLVLMPQSLFKNDNCVLVYAIVCATQGDKLISKPLTPPSVDHSYRVTSKSNPVNTLRLRQDG